MKHPAILLPSAKREHWTPQAIAEALASGEIAPQQPLGAVHLRLVPG